MFLLQRNAMFTVNCGPPLPGKFSPPKRLPIQTSPASSSGFRSLRSCPLPFLFIPPPPPPDPPQMPQVPAVYQVQSMTEKNKWGSPKAYTVSVGYTTSQLLPRKQPAQRSGQRVWCLRRRTAGAGGGGGSFPGGRDGSWLCACSQRVAPTQRDGRCARLAFPPCSRAPHRSGHGLEYQPPVGNGEGAAPGG